MLVCVYIYVNVCVCVCMYVCVCVCTLVCVYVRVFPLQYEDRIGTPVRLEGPEEEQEKIRRNYWYRFAIMYSGMLTTGKEGNHGHPSPPSPSLSLSLYLSFSPSRSIYFLLARSFGFVKNISL